MLRQKLPTFNQLKTFIDTNHHLPEIPSAEEVVKHGSDLGAMDAKLLKKIEELTLYVLELKNENEKQEEVITKLSKKVKL